MVTKTWFPKSVATTQVRSKNEAPMVPKLDGTDSSQMVLVPHGHVWVSGFRGVAALDSLGVEACGSEVFSN